MALPQSFKAMVVSETAEKTFAREIKQRALNNLPAGELIIEVKYSSLNYKDALSATGNKGVTRKYPHTPGIDAAGAVVAGGPVRIGHVHDVHALARGRGMHEPLIAQIDADMRERAVARVVDAEAAAREFLGLPGPEPGDRSIRGGSETH